jgi:endoribonuclease Dicer
MSITFPVLVHDVILASAQDSTATIAARRACLFALDALEGDAAFLTRTCDCRSVQMKRAHKKKALENFFSGFAEEDEVDILTVEGVLAETDDGRSESLSL